MARKLRVALPLLFAFVFAFTLIVTMHTTAAASGACDYLAPRPGCCILAYHCEYPRWHWHCGYGEWNGETCVKAQNQALCPAPAACVYP